MFPIFIYALVSERDGRQMPYYVGQALEPDLRLNVDHLKKITNSAKGRWIQKELSAGFAVGFRLLEECPDKATADERECYWIEVFRSHNPDLTNTGSGNKRAQAENWKARLQKAAVKHRAQLAKDKEWLDGFKKT